MKKEGRERIIKKLAGKKTLIGAALGIAVFLIIFFIFLSPTKQVSASGIQANFAYLSTVHTSLCSSGFSTAHSFVYSKPNDSYLQGSCCTAMDSVHYAEQIQGLQNYSSIQQIPKDPYNISVSMAKTLIGYDNISLSASQQAVYDQAVNMSKNKGPCCCKCWRWYAFEGLAKYLITNYNYDASQIAHIWDLEDGCGG